MSKSFFAAVVAACVLVAGGCGGDDGDTNTDRVEGDEAQVAAVIDQLGKAAREGDAKTICEDLLTENLQISIRRAAGTSCSQEVTENIVGDDTAYEVDDVELQAGGAATARVTDQDDRRSELVLQQEGGQWRIARIG